MNRMGSKRAITALNFLELMTLVVGSWGVRIRTGIARTKTVSPAIGRLPRVPDSVDRPGTDDPVPDGGRNSQAGSGRRVRVHRRVGGRRAAGGRVRRACRCP